MTRVAISIAALTLLSMGTAFADMAAGAFHCSNTESQLIWRGASPAHLLLEGSSCGSSSSGQACPTTANELLTLVERRGCRGARSGTVVEFVCTGNENRVKNRIDELCEAVLP
jgi:hypothetical protein